MGDFDRATMHLDKAFGFVGAPHEWVSRKDETDKVIICERGDLVMVFNFHPERSFTDYRIGCKLPGPYKVRSIFICYFIFYTLFLFLFYFQVCLACCMLVSFSFCVHG